MRLFIVFLSIVVVSCSSSRVDLESYTNKNADFPVSNSGKNIAFYSIKTDLNWPIRVSPDELKNYVSWSHAIDLILDGQVKNIFQAHTLQVDLELESGIWVSSIEPSIDTVFVIIERCGDLCKNIGLMIEQLLITNSSI